MELYAAFDHIDTGDDNRIDLSEFKQGLVFLKDWGVEVADAEEEFKIIDQGAGGAGGQILFDEFCHWALRKGLDYDKDMPEDTEADGTNPEELDVLMKNRQQQQERSRTRTR